MNDLVRQLQDRIAALEAEVAQRDAAKAQWEEKIARLLARIAWLERQLFSGGKSEKVDRNQLLLELEGLQKEVHQVRELQRISYERQAPAPKPQPKEAVDPFAKLPVDEVIEIIPKEVQANPDAYELIGEESTYEVDIREPRVYKRQIVRKKYRLKADASRPPVIAPAPERPVQGRASAGLLTWIVISKLCDHLPLYRQEKMLARWGAPISRQSMNDWFRVTAEWFEPIYRLMDEDLRKGDYLQVDETPVRCNDPDEKDGRSLQGYLWVKSRPGGDVVFHWRMGRQHAVVEEILKGFHGVLHTDGYEAYSKFAAVTPRIRHAACWVHARRKFFEARTESPKTVDCVLRLIAHLYKLESKWDAEGITPARRAQVRQEKFARTLRWLRQIAINLRSRSLPKSGLGEASTYLLNQWDALIVHLQVGHTKLDTNHVENAIRPTAIGKKNWLFVGHPNAGQRMAVLYSIILSCLRRGINPSAYMRDVLKRLPSMTTRDDLVSMMPGNWQPLS